MTITEAEGQAFAASFKSAFEGGFASNNHDETMKGMFADKVYLSSSDGTEGEFSNDGIMKHVKEWGSMTDSYITGKTLVSVDTDQSRIVISSRPVSSISGGLVDCGECVEILLLNDNKQVIRWSGVFDPNTNLLDDAITKVSKKLGKEFPKPKMPTMPITAEEGREFAESFLKATAEGFPKNNHKEIFGRFLADELSWDWSDGTKGEGTFNDILKIIEANWGSMCDSFLYSEPTIAVDTNKSVIALTYQTFMNITGGFSDENNPIKFNQGAVFHLNEDKKCVKWHMCWNHNDSDLQAAFANVMKRLEAAKQTSKIVETPTSGFATGQHIQQGQ